MRDWTLILGGNIIAWFGAAITPESVASTIGAIVASVVAVVAGIANIRVAASRRKAAQDDRVTAAALRAKAEAEARTAMYAEQIEQHRRCTLCIAGMRVSNCSLSDKPENCPQNQA